ncbi:MULTISPECIES: EF-hand domain-containing protein [unclassified Luteimonas]|uniref:EF-hand domain-containing protein n=1 Tax=unclassified Luteimonas TaxID=2629088 RepID=UPI0018F0AC11|nr:MULTISPECIES: EF-hand domain-containing protein [unclassified Luteimonas]MBJ6978699.1 hypothetical protein [Luteimonas sp. MC1895]MBJ6983599.1 hypothetical protein [Luteimonas sp. MC1750]QQO06443.1 hypothetical protein JGR68_03075 [Luteimonas sp. MC1750]
MKRHALFFATALALASVGVAGMAAAQSPSVAPAKAAAGDATRDAKSERPMRDGRHGAGHHGRRGPGGHAMWGGVERMDADGDGRVSRAEFDAAKAARDEARQAHAARMAERRAAPGTAAADAPPRMRDGYPDGPRMGRRAAVDFDAIDANRDGFIVRTEVAAHQERTRAQRRAEGGKRLAEAFAAADLNRDGKLSRVEVDEKMPRLSKRFAWMDDNRDGVLSRAELEAGKRR